jgi:arylsulfatase
VGEYDKGWDIVRKERLKRQKELGIIPENAQLAERMWYVPDYSILAPAARAVVGKKMELYAGLVENLDHHIGRLVDHLKKIGEYENTIFIVFGDNGAEGNDLGAMIGGTPGTLNYLFFASKWSNNNPNAWGEPNSYVGYGAGWAQVSMTPFSQYKGMIAEGGIRNALIVSGPINKLPKGSINHGTMFVGDIMPTLLEVAGGKYPETFNGKAQPKLTGKSWLPVLNGQASSPRTDKDYIAWEVFGNRAVRQGDWKIRWEIKPLGKSDWELFNLAQDPAERNDLAAQNPDKLKGMLVLWDKYAKENNVILPDRTVFETMEDQLPQRFPVQEGYPPLLNIRQFMPPAAMMAEPKEIKKN